MFLFLICSVHVLVLYFQCTSLHLVLEAQFLPSAPIQEHFDGSLFLFMLSLPIFTVPFRDAQICHS